MLYNIFVRFGEIGGEIAAVDVASGLASFFVVALGGVLLGVAIGVLGAFGSRCGT